MIYFVQEHNNPNGLIKIGKTANLENRLKALQSCSPVPLIVLGTIKGEWRTDCTYHRKFAQSRVYGEWFLPSPDLMAFIELEVRRPSIASSKKYAKRKTPADLLEYQWK